MSWIFVDKESEGGMRSQMRRNMRGGDYRSMGGSSAMMHNDYNEGYRMGYKHGWEDKDDDWDEESEHYRRRRDSSGRFM